MGLILELEESDFAGYIDDGMIYTATVSNVGLKERPPRNPGDDPTRRIEFRFKIISDDAHDGQDIWGSTSTKFVNHEKCKLYSWSQAILGQVLPVRFKLDTDDLHDRSCRIVVSKRSWPDKTTGEERTRNEVADVMPTRAAMAQMAADTSDDEF